MPSQNTPTVTREGKKAELHLQGNLTAAEVPALREVVKALVAEGVTDLVVDLAGVQGIDSSGIGLLVAAHNSLTRLSGALIVINASADLLELFKAFRLDKHFSVRGTPAAS